jgi:hypothetical protein
MIINITAPASEAICCVINLIGLDVNSGEKNSDGQLTPENRPGIHQVKLDVSRAPDMGVPG